MSTGAFPTKYTETETEDSAMTSTPNPTDSGKGSGGQTKTYRGEYMAAEAADTARQGGGSLMAWPADEPYVLPTLGVEGRQITGGLGYKTATRAMWKRS
ncbi:hypothetical protein QBC46DRAFT_348367 [Diplogelasinospora grovesii]|uniref:Uncharacterized protein n=1 Tax=Diplogelasinospora grovesii TaxID=303347 RepID=A0AAN6RYD8_9PEZI|nr:hypothetical protein QBC46DRAFT_348367 [Diplogelasinospora grovesii]